MLETWFTEYHNKNVSFSLRIREAKTYKSELQEISVLDSYEFGKVLVLDNTIQLTERDEFIYHEMIVHVSAMTAVLNLKPKRVLVIGGGDGGSVRELLKYDIDEIYLVDIDKSVIETCIKEFSFSRCLNDKRVKIFNESGDKFIKKYKNFFDIIIADTPDPKGIAEVLFSKEFYSNVYGALTDNGILTVQSESPFYHADTLRKIYRSLKEIFPIVRVYLAPIPSYPSGLWSFTLASKKFDPLSLNKERIKEMLRRFSTKYYNEEIHFACFALPNFVKEVIE